MKEKEIYDVIGIGFGPSNLSFAVAIDELSEGGTPVSALFLEQKPEFQWHPEMLLPGAEMQISFIKDLVTLRNPTSQFSFLNYLKQCGRLPAFANLRTFYPSRVEFNDYFRWVATSFDGSVRYGHRVVSIVPVGDSPYKTLQIRTRDVETGVANCFFARNVVVASGSRPSFPDAIGVKQSSDLVWHSSEHLARIRRFEALPDKTYHFLVVGRGQSAVEIARDLYNRFPRALVTLSFRGFGLKPADDSEFVNEIFDASGVDFLMGVSAEVRQKVLSEHRDTNYSVADADLIRELYKARYADSVTGSQRLEIRNLSEVTGVAECGPKVDVSLLGLCNGRKDAMQVDAVILATGYTSRRLPDMLDSLSRHMCHEDGFPIVDRDYRIRTEAELDVGIYLQGTNERTHGLSDTLLSVLPVRSAEILTSIQRSIKARGLPGFSGASTPTPQPRMEMTS